MIWRVSDVMDGYQYGIELRHSKDGKRSLSLRPLNNENANGAEDTVIFVSQIVPNDLLRRRDIISISEQVLLQNGQSFFVDAHGIWFSAAESAQIDAGIELAEIQWDTDSPPKLSPS